MVRLLQGGWFHDTIASELLGNPLANREHGAPFCKKKKSSWPFVLSQPTRCKQNMDLFSFISE
jgi:hypothetical protein